MEVSSDPYELKLFQMFTSCDTNRSGTLDENALSKLCEMLELQDRGSVIIKSLIKKPRSRVSFEDFKEALLNFLGTEIDGSLSPGDRALFFSDEPEQKHRDSPPNSSDREVSPKFVVGAKKYGRRSRPQFIGTDSSPSESDDQEICQQHLSNNTVQRSSSQSDILSSSHRRRPICGGTKLKRCASLPVQKDPRVRDAILEKTKAAKIANKTSSSMESLDIPIQLETVPAHSIIEMWERVSISNAKGLLLSFGFDEEEVNVTQLSKVLEEEIRSLPDEAQTTLLKASLALQTAELSTLKQSYLQMSEENKKLHADNKDANRRVVLLAQEIDERHANLEDTTKKEIRLLEQRHAELVRDLTARMANDRENWSNLTVRLETKIKSLEQEEIRLKSEAESLREENSALEMEQTSLQKQITNLLETNIELNKEIAESEERNRSDEGSKSEKENEEMLELIEKITSLQVENANLRDKNDELLAEIEGLNFEISRVRTKKTQKVTLGTDDDGDHSSAAMKRRGDSPSKTRITEESPRLGKLRKCNTDTNSESDTSGDWVALNSELKSPMNITSLSTSSGFSQESSCSQLDSKDQELAALRKKVSQLEAELKSIQDAAQQNNGSTSSSGDEVANLKKERDALQARCKELETGLEQMQKAYEDCEDYWQEKLSEERQLFEKERKIYEEEQKESDIKFTELAEKVREYEEQFSKDGRLSPIEEKYSLEQQYADLEAEAEQIRENARQIFEEKSKEIESLKNEIEDLKLKLGESVEILTGANEMQSEMSDMESPASSPISYLWHQSTIQCPVTQYKNNSQQKTSPHRSRLNNLSTSETTVFSTTQTTIAASKDDECKNISPIQKPNTPKVNSDMSKDCDDCSSSTASAKSFESQSVASTHSMQKSSIQMASNCSSPNIVKEELKRLKCFEMQLKEQIRDLALQRDSLVMELQQLQEAKPVLEKAYARAAHPSLIQRVNHLELKNRHLQNVIKQQHQYTESLLQQTWQQQHNELSDLRNRLEAQAVIMTEQTQRLANADVLVKELYVENSHLTATIQRLEQQMCRVNMLHQHPSMSGLPGMP